MDISPLLLNVIRYNVIRYIVGLSIIYVGMSLFRYFLELESFYIKRFRKKSAHTTHRALLVRASVGLGLIFPISVTLGMIIVGWELFHPAVWPTLLISLGLGTGVAGYAYFRLFKYQKLSVEASEYRGVEVDKVFVNRESLSSGVTLLHPRVVRFLVWAIIIESLLALFIHPAISD